MIYSMNPFRWLLWLCQKIRWRKSKWQLYHCPVPLSRKGQKVLKDRLRELFGLEKPVGVPEWLAKDPESYGYKDESEPLDSIVYKGVPFFYHPCFCDHTVGENCEACRPEGDQDD